MTDRKVIIETREVCRDIPIKEGLIFPRQVDVLHAVNKVSLSVYEGETLALVGQSGAGKTTAAHLLLRFWDPGSGALHLDGDDLRSYRLVEMRDRIALVCLLYTTDAADDSFRDIRGLSHLT